MIDLSHTWELQSPLAPVNPPYSFALSATHGKTGGTFNDQGQLSFAAEQMHCENLFLEELAAARAYEFAVVVSPLKAKDGTGSAVRIFALVPR